MMDIHLPDGNGIEYLLSLTLLYPDIPVIIISAYGHDEEIVQAIKNGATDYFTKGPGFEMRVADFVKKTLKNKQLELELESTRKKYEVIFNSANDLIFTLNLNGNFTSVNNKLVELFHAESHQEFIGKNFLDVLPDETKIKAGEVFGRILEGEITKNKLFELHIFNNNNEQRFIEINPSLLKEGESIIGVLCVGRDVTSSKKNKLKQNELHFRLMEKQQLALIGNMVQGIAHNINTPLATIMGHCELLELKLPDVKELETIYRQCDYISKVIQNMVRKVQNEQSMASEWWNINDIIEEEIKFFSADNEFKHHIYKKVNLGSGLPKIKMIYQNFSQAFDAFIQNAIEAVKPMNTKEIEIETFQEKEFIYLNIIDSGIGIKEDCIEKLFKPFFTTKNSDVEKHLGLSLYNAYVLMQPYGIEFKYSQKDNKTCFTWKIPIQN
jgi:PAS domain S-box-containing protein